MAQWLFETECSSLKALPEAAATCTRCDLYTNATQTLFGEELRRVAQALRAA